ncbi:MAG: Uma2 family endonuclease [Deltaproteobacteria bacterium]|nr:Uma2 family endonuclease [Deltaproteobacteria bacterium]
MFDPRELAPETIRVWSRHEYDRLVSLGMFAEERIELLRGMLVTMSPQGVAHSGITAWFAQWLIRHLDERWDVRSHSPYAAGDDSEPEPDVSVSPATNNPTEAHPSKAVLLIEISDSSLAKDRRIKAPIYAEAGVPEYWIVDISGDQLCVEVHTDPAPSGYRRVEILRDDDVLRPTQLLRIEIAVREIPWKR